jgi:hypothetical protein
MEPSRKVNPARRAIPWGSANSNHAKRRQRTAMDQNGAVVEGGRGMREASGEPSARARRLDPVASVLA